MELTLSILKDLLATHGDGVLCLNADVFNFNAVLAKSKTKTSIVLVRALNSPPRNLRLMVNKLEQYDRVPIRLEKNRTIQAVYFDTKNQCYHLSDSVNMEHLLIWRHLASDKPSHFESLTPAELDVLKWMAKGYNNDQIGEMLFITKATLSCHIGKIYKKLKVSDRTNACLYAIKHGLIGTEEIEA